MKLLIILSLISFNSYACLNKLPLSEVQKAINLEAGAGAKSCADLPEEDCLCYDGIDWHTAEIKDEIINGKPIYSAKFNVTTCETEEDCETLRATLCTDAEFFYAENIILPGFEAYCTKITGYEQIFTGKKVLKVNTQKQAAHLAKLEAEQSALKLEADKKATVRAKLKNFDKSKITSIADAREWLGDIVELLK
jgi:hypothetical protein